MPSVRTETASHSTEDRILQFRTSFRICISPTDTVHKGAALWCLGRSSMIVTLFGHSPEPRRLAQVKAASRRLSVLHNDHNVRITLVHEPLKRSDLAALRMNDMNHIWIIYESYMNHILYESYMNQSMLEIRVLWCVKAFTWRFAQLSLRLRPSTVLITFLKAYPGKFRDTILKRHETACLAICFHVFAICLRVASHFQRVWDASWPWTSGHGARWRSTWLHHRAEIRNRSHGTSPHKKWPAFRAPKN